MLVQKICVPSLPSLSMQKIGLSTLPHIIKCEAPLPFCTQVLCVRDKADNEFMCIIGAHGPDFGMLLEDTEHCTYSFPQTHTHTHTKHHQPVINPKREKAINQSVACKRMQ